MGEAHLQRTSDYDQCDEAPALRTDGYGQCGVLRSMGPETRPVDGALRSGSVLEIHAVTPSRQCKWCK